MVSAGVQWWANEQFLFTKWWAKGRNKVGVLRTNKLWFLSRDYWRIHEMNHLDVDSDHEQFFFRDPIFPGKPTSLSNKPNIQKRLSMDEFERSYMFFEICIVLVSATFLVNHSCSSLQRFILSHQAHLGYPWWYHSSVIPWVPLASSPSSEPPRTGDSPWQLASRCGEVLKPWAYIQ